MKETKAILKKGLSCCLNLNLISEDGFYLEGNWVEIIDILDDKVQGIIKKNTEYGIVEDTKIEFEISSILRLRGDLDWTIENLLVNVSQEIIDGNEIGYFYNSFDENPLNYGRSFYSINEVYKPKASINLVDYPLKELCRKEPNLINFLENFAYCGIMKDSTGIFKILNDEDIIDKDRKVFPCFYELD